jgi:hypothetical protein
MAAQRTIGFNAVGWRHAGVTRCGGSRPRSRQLDLSIAQSLLLADAVEKVEN